MYLPFVCPILTTTGCFRGPERRELGMQGATGNTANLRQILSHSSVMMRSLFKPFLHQDTLML